MKSPAFRLYAADLIASTAGMTAEQFGAYMRLLCYQWTQGGVPDDDTVVAAVCGICSADAAAKAKAKLTRCEDGMLRHPRLEDERQKQAEFAHCQSEKGRRSAEARRANRGSTPVQPRLNPGSTPVQPSLGSTQFEPSVSVSVSASVSDSVTASKEAPDRHNVGLAPDNAQLPGIVSGASDGAVRCGDTTPPTKTSPAQPNAQETASTPKRETRKFAEEAKAVLQHLNQAAGRSFSEVDTNLDLIRSRLQEVGGDVPGVLRMVNRQVEQWRGDPNMETYLRPATLFNKTKFRTYYDDRDQPARSTKQPHRNDSIGTPESRAAWRSKAAERIEYMRRQQEERVKQIMAERALGIE